METIPKKAESVVSLVGNSKFFNVEFVKRTTGEVRNMTCRRGVKKFLHGGTIGYNPEKKNLITVWEPDARGKNGPNDEGYRCISVNGIQRITFNNRVFVSKGDFLVEQV